MGVVIAVSSADLAVVQVAVGVSRPSGSGNEQSIITSAPDAT